ncbi:MAG TPA: aromatic ring-hydroxylating dioxygenase subunit alpha [Pyrinomonadaceae bacterium]
MSIFDINSDIRQAQTLPSEFYTNPDFFEQSKERIFARSWQIVGTTDDLRLAGQMQPHTILEGFLDEPVLLVRVGDNVTNCLSNVCTHRGNILVEHPCVENGIRCRYHGRKFSLNGKFVSMPEFEGVENFPAKSDDLPRVPFGSWGKFLLASIKPAAPLEHFLSEMNERMSWLEWENFKFNSVLSRDYLVKAHWALYCENYLEGFHIPFVHNTLNSVVDYGSYTTELFRRSNLQIGLTRGEKDVFDLPKSSPDYGKSIGAYYFWIFPNLMFNFYPWGLSVNIVKPINPGLTKVSFLSYVADEKKLSHGAGADLERVEREDEAVVENVQRGIRSRFYRQGRYSPTRETGTHHFHRLIAEFMKV